MNRAGSNRVGWNARGGTISDDLAWAMHQSETANHDSVLWESKARFQMEQLRDMLGTDDYLLWTEITWPGEVIKEKTWKQIYEDANAARSAGVEALHYMLECRCDNRSDIACPACGAKARRMEVING